VCNGLLNIGAHTLTLTANDGFNSDVSTSIEVDVAYGICPLYDEAGAVRPEAAFPIKIMLCDDSGDDLSAAGTVVQTEAVHNWRAAVAALFPAGLARTVASASG
jgi:hypothetical protein